MVMSFYILFPNVSLSIQQDIVPDCIPYKKGVNLAAKDFFKTVRAENAVLRMTADDCLQSCMDNDDCLQWNFGAFRDGTG